MQQALTRHAEFAVETAIRRADLGDHAGAIGAAVIARDALRSGW
jgi:activator of 2-hydroxyglutaryl-CoA dehydratase